MQGAGSGGGRQRKAGTEPSHAPQPKKVKTTGESASGWHGGEAQWHLPCLGVVQLLGLVVVRRDLGKPLRLDLDDLSHVP